MADGEEFDLWDLEGELGVALSTDVGDGVSSNGY